MSVSRIRLWLKKSLWAFFLVNMFAMSSMATVAGEHSHPNILINADEIAMIKVKVAAGEAPWKSPYDKMMSQAKSALTLPMMSVTFGGKNLCGGNKVLCANVLTAYTLGFDVR